MKSQASHSSTSHQLIFWAALAACLVLTMFAWITAGTPGDQPAPRPPRHGASLRQQEKSQSHAQLSASIVPASSSTGNLILPASDQTWDENSALFVQQRLAELSTGPLLHMLAFAESMTEGDFKTTAWLQVLETIAASPQDASLLEAALKKTPLHLMPQAWSAVADGRAHHDPSEAMRWITTLSDSAVRESCALRIVSQWGSRDPTAALAWLDSQPADEHWEPLLQSIVASWASAQPSQAMQWAAQMTNSDANNLQPSLTALVERVVAEQIDP